MRRPALPAVLIIILSIQGLFDLHGQLCGPAIPQRVEDCPNLCFIAAPCREGCSGGALTCGPGLVMAYADCLGQFYYLCTTTRTCSDPACGGNGSVEAAVYSGSGKVSWQRSCCN